MRSIFLILLSIAFVETGYSQNIENYANITFLEHLNKDSSYVRLRRKVVSEYMHAKPGRWGEFVHGVDEDLCTEKKYIAFTFDACGGERGNGYNEALIVYLKKEKIPATLFVTGRWIDSHFKTLIELSKDSLFEIENHGLSHKPCSIDGESEYGISGTSNVSDAFDEIEANARKIEAIIHYKPIYYRSATAFIDEACARMAKQLDITAVSFQVLSGDAVAFTPAIEIEENVLKNIKPGAIVIMHFNHPEWYTAQAIALIVPKLRERGYEFVQLNDFRLRGR